MYIYIHMHFKQCYININQPMHHLCFFFFLNGNAENDTQPEVSSVALMRISHLATSWIQSGPRRPVSLKMIFWNGRSLKETSGQWISVDAAGPVACHFFFAFPGQKITCSPFFYCVA